MKQIYGIVVLVAIIALGAARAEAKGVIPTSMPVGQGSAVLGATAVAQPARGVVPTSMPIASNGDVLGMTHYQFDRNLKLGSTGEDVRMLQVWLNTNGYPVAATGVGSAGYETTSYGARTAEAVKRLQEANAGIVLIPAGLTKGTGQFGVLTRAFVNSFNN